MEEPVATRPSSNSAAAPFSTIWNVPNQITVARLVLSVLCFVCLVFDSYLPALVLFVIAAGTDWVDGYWARRYGQITQLGRIMDPFADKVVICGTFVLLAAVPPVFNVVGLDASASEIWGWMAVVVIARELLVTALRSFFEEHGTDFSAQWAGKWKMVLQCAAAAVSLWRLWYYQFDTTALRWDIAPSAWSTWLLRLTVWAAVAITIYSGWTYVQSAIRLVKQPT
jgi:CDP-diacylglycerol--glycerol-3-phosphate 3-phosphatidyltransferase